MKTLNKILLTTTLLGNVFYGGTHDQKGEAIAHVSPLGSARQANLLQQPEDDSQDRSAVNDFKTTIQSRVAKFLAITGTAAAIYYACKYGTNANFRNSVDTAVIAFLSLPMEDMRASGQFMRHVTISGLDIAIRHMTNLKDLLAD
jgi:hypothetical protein